MPGEPVPQPRRDTTALVALERAQSELKRAEDRARTANHWLDERQSDVNEARKYAVQADADVAAARFMVELLEKYVRSQQPAHECDNCPHDDPGEPVG